MKTIKLMVLALALGIFAAPKQAKSQAVDAGNILIDAYYGFPNLFTSALKTTYANSGSVEDVNIGGIGPVGGRFEYMVSEKIGIGLEINYTDSYVEYTDLGTDTLGNPYRYEYKVSVPRLRIMPRFNFHFGSSDVFDGYFAVAAGYNNTQYKFESNDPDFGDESITGLVPVAFRLAVGGRYFFTDAVGIHMELGLGGGALINGGLSFKF